MTASVAARVLEKGLLFNDFFILFTIEF
jgi:hypothetical protein